MWQKPGIAGFCRPFASLAPMLQDCKVEATLTRMQSAPNRLLDHVDGWQIQSLIGSD